MLNLQSQKDLEFMAPKGVELGLKNYTICVNQGVNGSTIMPTTTPQFCWESLMNGKEKYKSKNINNKKDISCNSGGIPDLANKKIFDFNKFIQAIPQTIG